MSLGDWFRRLFSSGAKRRVDLGLAPDETAGATETSAGGMAPGRPGTPAAAEAAEAEIESQEAPPDPTP